jgi:hypothetical protein
MHVRFADQGESGRYPQPVGARLSEARDALDQGVGTTRVAHIERRSRGKDGRSDIRPPAIGAVRHAAKANAHRCREYSGEKRASAQLVTMQHVNSHREPSIKPRLRKPRLR